MMSPHSELRGCLAQVPSVTSVSRQALVSGLRPARLADTLVTTRHEERRWREYWQALMPAGRKAFAPQRARVVSHGGLTIDEMVVPLIHIER